MLKEDLQEFFSFLWCWPFRISSGAETARGVSGSLRQHAPFLSDFRLSGIRK